MTPAAPVPIRWSTRQAVLTVVLALAMWVGFQALAGWALRLAGITGAAEVFGVVLAATLAWLLGAEVARRQTDRAWADLGLRGTSWHWLLLASVIGLTAPLLLAVINLVVITAFQLPVENPQLDIILPDGFSWTALLLTALGAGMLVPIAEEIFFRGFLFQSLRDRLGLWAGVLISALLFAALHLLPERIPAFLVMGVITAVLFHYSRSVIPSIIVHMLLNLTAILLAYLVAALGLLPA